MTTTKEKCIILRKKGFTLGEITKATKLPKSTIYYHIKNMPLPPEILKRIKENATKRINKFAKTRKGKCAPGRTVIKPEKWSHELIFLVAHFMFDGEIQTHSCIYHNRNIELINQVRSLMKRVFNLMPYKLFNKETGVYRISYHYVELADYMRKKVQELKKHIKTASLPEKKTFLKAFLMMKVALINGDINDM